jgi:hypothetical protein
MAGVLTSRVRMESMPRFCMSFKICSLGSTASMTPMGDGDETTALG